MGVIAPPFEQNSANSGDVQPFRRAEVDSGAFLRTLDMLTEGLAFFDLAANLLHANAPLQDLLRRNDGGERLRLELGSFSVELCSAARMRPREDRVEPMEERELATMLEFYRLRGCLIGLDLFGSGPTVLVTVQPSAPLLFSDEELKERFGLSRTESRVARLIADGRANREIADTLTISPHTARNHTSRVLAKLHARSRAEVGPRLRNG
jgi:DNA-binding CsgD family transcriptional regulator